ncbi:helix-turn-helix domain-containing protein [Streptomyces ruber]|nr:helix-turn-helix domain-containing protein [Streptomyces ruber]
MSATFIVSPLAQMGFQLNLGRMAAGGESWTQRIAVRELVSRRDLQLLRAIHREAGSYVPGFMFAHSVPQGVLETELHEVASTPAGIVACQMGEFLRRTQPGRRTAHPGSLTVQSFLEAGERSFAQRVARELSQFWSAFMSTRWNAIRTRMESDIRHRAASMARLGLSATLDSLHPSLTYASGALRIRDDRSCDLLESRRIVLHPSPVVKTWMLRDDPWGGSGTHLAYSIGTGMQDDHPETSSVTDPLGQVIGEARQSLLCDLGSPRTTTELAERHHMSASTVSYHLLRLYRVGLLNRTREGSRVYYQRTPEADRLVVRHGGRRGVRPVRTAVPETAAPALTRRFAGTLSAAPDVR